MSQLQLIAVNAKQSFVSFANTYYSSGGNLSLTVPSGAVTADFTVLPYGGSGAAGSATYVRTEAFKPYQDVYDVCTGNAGGNATTQYSNNKVLSTSTLVVTFNDPSRDILFSNANTFSIAHATDGSGVTGCSDQSVDNGDPPPNASSGANGTPLVAEVTITWK